MPQGLNNNALIIEDDGKFASAVSNWWNYRQISALDVSPGGSGATFVPPGANSIGGYQLDADTEYLYFGADVHSDWDGSSNAFIEVFFEVNINNGGGTVNDTVDLQVICRMKGDAEIAVRTQTLEVAKVVGQSPQFKQFTTELEIVYNDGGDPLNVDDVIGMRLNLETDTSEVDNIIVNHFEFKYQSTKPNAIEIA